MVVEKHRHEGAFVARKEDALVTRNMVVGESVYGEKRISVDEADGTKTEYRVWNPFRSKIAAGILGGLDNIHIKPIEDPLPRRCFRYHGVALLRFGRSGRDRVRSRVLSPFRSRLGQHGEEAHQRHSHHRGRRHPQKYRMLVGMVDTIFADVAQPDQARIVGLNAQYFLKQGGNFMISIKASCIDSTASSEAVFQRSQEAANGRLQAGRTAHVRTVRTRSRNGCWCFSGGKRRDKEFFVIFFFSSRRDRGLCSTRRVCKILQEFWKICV